MSLPEYSKLYNPNNSINETRWHSVNILLKNPKDREAVKKLKGEFEKVIPPNKLSYGDYFDNIEVLEKIDGIISNMFNIIIAITMFMCFFSLCSSMTANLMDQTKEIGIMLAMGMTKKRIKLLYFYEAFILVSSSSMLGVMIGSIVSYFMVL